MLQRTMFLMKENRDDLTFGEKRKWFLQKETKDILLKLNYFTVSHEQRSQLELSRQK